MSRHTRHPKRLRVVLAREKAGAYSVYEISQKRHDKQMYAKYAANGPSRSR